MPLVIKEVLKYVISQYKCRVEGCPVKVDLIAHQERDVLEVAMCNLDHNHEHLIPDQDLVGRSVEEIEDPVQMEEAGFQNNTGNIYIHIRVGRQRLIF